MRVLLAALECQKGDLGGNLSSHRRIVTEAAATGCDLVLFPEMSLTGSVDPARNPERLVSLENQAVLELVRASAEMGLGICFGLAEHSSEGRAHIAQVLVSAGQYRRRTAEATSRRRRGVIHPGLALHSHGVCRPHTGRGDMC